MTNTTTASLEPVVMDHAGSTIEIVVSFSGDSAVPPSRPVPLPSAHVTPNVFGFVVPGGQNSTASWLEDVPKPWPLMVRVVPPTGDPVGGVIEEMLTP